MKTIRRFLVVWVAAATAALGQGLEAEMTQMREEMRALRADVERRAEREAALVERVAELEAKVESSHREGAAADRPAWEQEVDQALDDLAEKIDAAGEPDFPVRIGGYFDIEFRDDQAAEHTTFDQHRLIIKLDADVADWISFRSEIEIEGGGVDDFLTDNAIAVEFAEAHFHFDPAFNLKAGALLVPFNRYNYLHDSPLQDLTDRPLVDRYIVPTTWTEAGIGAYGGFECGRVVLDYDVIVCNGLDDGFSSTPGGGFRGARSSFREDNNDDKMLIGRIGATFDVPCFDVVSAGISAATGKYDDDGRHRLTMFGFDALIRKGPFELLGEYAVANLDRGPDQIAGGVPGGASGYYVQLGYHWFPECWRGATPFFTRESTFTLVCRYNSIDTDDSARGIDRQIRGDAFRDDLRSIAFGINFRPIERTVFKAEYQWFPESGSIAEADNDRLVFSIATSF